MCGRFNIIPDARAWLTAWRIVHEELQKEWMPRYNVPPSEWVPVIRATNGELVVDRLRWSFVPNWTREERPSLRNIARGETVATNGLFRESFRKRRCVFVISSFYEWHRPTEARGPKTPFHIHHSDGSPMFVAGIWDTWRGVDGAAMITIGPNAVMEAIHDRMQVLVPPEAVEDWILGAEPEKYLRPPLEEGMVAERISMAVNSTKNDGPELTRPVGGHDL
jgi:putative SOS response-associated peptidase YedK